MALSFGMGFKLC